MRGDSWAFFFPMMVVAAPFAVGVAYYWASARQKAREYEHLERMKALEIGLLLPADRPKLSPQLVGLLIALIVPSLALSTLIVGIVTQRATEDMSIAVAAVGCTGLGVGAWLARLPAFGTVAKGERDSDREGLDGERRGGTGSGSGSGSVSAVAATSGVRKPGGVADPDAYDVAGRRG